MERAGRKAGFLPFLILAFGVLNAVLYGLLLPLWEGFDEPFHFAYAQTLAVRAEFPELGKARLSREVMESLRLAPASHVVRHNLPFVTTFDEFAALPENERHARREALRNLPVVLRESEDPSTSNYEAQQAPLAYLALSWGERRWRTEPLIERVVMLRLAAALAACLLQFWFTLKLARMLELPPGATAMALFLVFSAQMFYGATAHISNDWLAVPLTTLAVVMLLRFWRSPGRWNGVLLGAALAAGLMTKAYFLFWTLLAAMMAAWLVLRKRAPLAAALAMAGTATALAGPWYVRNVVLYGNVGGLLTATGIGLPDVWSAVKAMPWPHVLDVSARSAIWTGNNSFTVFSASTVYAALFLMAATGIVWVWRSRKTEEWLLAAGCAGFCTTLMYAGAVFYAYTKNGQYTQAPWYPQAISAPLACLLALGISRAGRAGRWLGAALCGTAAYLIGATYLVKLIPTYAGYGGGAIKPARLLAWYLQGSWIGVLHDIAPGNPYVILCLASAVPLMAAAICVALWRGGSPCK